MKGFLFLNIIVVILFYLNSGNYEAHVIIRTEMIHCRNLLNFNHIQKKGDSWDFPECAVLNLVN